MDQSTCSVVICSISLLSLLSCVVGTPLLPLCEMGYFYDLDNQICTVCSECPLNHIIRQPCTSISDTVCGPFYEFEFFNQGASNSKPEKEKDEKRNREFNLFKVDSTKQPSMQDLMKKRPSKDIIQTEGPSIHNETTKWKELCYGLIGALVVLAIIFTTYVVIAQVQISRLHTKAKESNVPENGEETIYCYTQLCTGQQQKTEISSVSSQQGHRLPPIYRPGQARRVINNVPVRASPNEYVLQNTGTQKDSEPVEQANSSSSRLLPVIPEGEHSDNCDHVRVLYTN